MTVGAFSYEEVEYGKSIGIDFIVTDHHNINDRPADCILINPKQADCPYPFKHLAGCGVAFKLAQGLQRKASLPKINADWSIGSGKQLPPSVISFRWLMKTGL